MIMPEQIAKDSEHSHQAALFCWAALFKKQCEDNVANVFNDHNAVAAMALANLFAIPNGDQRGDGSAKGAMIAGARLKAEGQRNGVPDIMLAWPKRAINCSGLFIEMKAPRLKPVKLPVGLTHSGGCSVEQLDWHKRLIEAGYAVKVCYSWIEARDTILEYLS